MTNPDSIEQVAPKLDLSALKLKVKEPEAEPAKLEQSAPEVLALDAAKTMQEQGVWQHYKCSRQSMRMTTTCGKKFHFAQFEMLTQDEDVIGYLDSEIKNNSMIGITKGALMTADDKDPMAALKRKHIAEYIAEQAKAAADKASGIIPDMGSTKAAGTHQLNPAHSGNVAN